MPRFKLSPEVIEEMEDAGLPVREIAKIEDRRRRACPASWLSSDGTEHVLDPLTESKRRKKHG